MSDETRGPVILRQIPATKLVGHQAYALPHDCTREDFEGAAAWVRFHGGEVKVCDDEGLLVVSRYLDEDGHPDGSSFHEWIAESSLIVFDDAINEFTTYGHSMGEHYIAEPMAGDLE